MLWKPQERQFSKWTAHWNESDMLSVLYNNNDSDGDSDNDTDNDNDNHSHNDNDKDNCIYQHIATSVLHVVVIYVTAVAVRQFDCHPTKTPVLWPWSSTKLYF